MKKTKRNGDTKTRRDNGGSVLKNDKCKNDIDKIGRKMQKRKLPVETLEKGEKVSSAKRKKNKHLLNDSLERVKNQVSHVRTKRKSAASGSSIDKINDLDVKLDKDLSASNSVFPHNTSTPINPSKTRRPPYRRKRLKIRSLDLDDNANLTSKDDVKLKSAGSDISLLNLSLPTPLPPSDFIEPFSKDMEFSSDEEDLPEGITPIKMEKGFSENCIVWVKWKKWPHLPALVKKVYHKKKRVTCQVFGPTNLLEDFTLSYGKPDAVIPYCDPSKDQIIAGAQKLNKTDKDYFNGCLANAENYFIKESLKTLQEAGLFKEKRDHSASLYTEVDSDDGEITPRNKKRKLSPDCYISKVEKKKNGLSKQGQKRIERNFQKTRPLTEYLVSQTTKEYLESIFKGTTPSELHAKFLTCTIRERAKMKHRGFGPIDDDSQIEQLLNTYIKWLTVLNKQSKIPIHEIHYVFDVWVPEAIVFALKKLKGYNKKRAWEQFNKGVRRTKEELQQFHEEMIAK